MYLKCNVFGKSVSVMYKTRLDCNHSQCIGSYTELIGWHGFWCKELINIGGDFVAIARLEYGYGT